MKIFPFGSPRCVVVMCAFMIGGCAASRRVLPPSSSMEGWFSKPSPMTLLSTSSSPTIKAKIDSLLSDSLFPPANVGIKIISLKTKETLYDLNARSLFNPASNQKLFTAAAALTLLGDSYQLSTVAYVDTASRTIFLKGFGDPLCTAENLDSLARIVQRRLPFRGTWRVVGDASYFDQEFWGFGWNWDDEPEAYQMFLTPLILNGNTIRLVAKPGKAAGDSVRVYTEPPTRFVTIENRGVTVRDSVVHPLKLSRKWRERLNVLTVDGEMRLSDTAGSRYDFSVWQPERYTTHVFAERLEKNGVIVYETGMDTLGAQAFEIGRISHRLDSVLTYMNKVSDNLSAETVLKVLGAEKKGTPGSAERGLAVVKEFLSQRGLDTTSMRLVDGSGLSRMNLTSPEAVVQLLQEMDNSEHASIWRHSLPVAGIDGTIGNRMRGTSAEGNLRAKTGTLTAVTTLSGYVQTADGEPLALSIMMMNYTKPASAYRQVQDRIATFLSQLRRVQF